MFTNLYLQTTDPKLKLSQLYSPHILPYIFISALFHTIIYCLFFNLASYVFFGKLLTYSVNARLCVTLFLIMSFGFLGRFFHVKDIYRAYHYDMEKTRAHLDKLYIGWIFIS